MKSNVRSKLSARKTGSSLLNSLTGKLPLEPNKAMNMALKPYIALDCFARKAGNNFLYGTLVQYAVVTELLCQNGYLQEEVDVVVEAQKQLVSVHARGNTSKVWDVRPEEYRALCDMLALYSAQLELVNPKDLLQAHTGMMQLVLEKLTAPAASSELETA
jgi:hypothetical protein